ncbi:hypothetical protein [Novosphingobium resinovorum]|uniref:hypothetical protein n=1 Tax=Novosphingobium resinovorum TaxID=158500 RepID=UPI002ED2F150
MQHGVDLTPFRARRQDNALNERTERVSCFLSFFRGGKRLGQSLHLTAVDLRDIWMDIRNIRRGCCEPGADGIFLRLEFQ